MARGGRKRKVGVERHPSGRIKKIKAPDKGCEGVQRRRALYGHSHPGETFDALGRAFAGGLIPKHQLDGGRKIAAQYWRLYGFHSPDSLARFQPSSAPGSVPDPAMDKIREDALNDVLDHLAKYGRNVRIAFDELVIDPNPDMGPAWLDRIMLGGGTERDFDMLRLAKVGLGLIT